MDQRKNKFKLLTEKFSAALRDGNLKDSSEETIRVWINEMLSVFGWDVGNTNQILQERTLEKKERQLLKNIGSHNVRPDYTFVNGKVKLAFLDAKSLDVNLWEDKSAAFQIRSYGWSIGAKFSVISNMRELAIYDCSVKPKFDEPASFARCYYFTVEQYVENFDVIDQFLNRKRVIKNNYHFSKGGGDPVDTAFAKFLGDFRVKLVKAIIASNPTVSYHTDDLTLWAQIILDRIIFIRVCEARGLEEVGLLLKYQEQGFWETFEHSSYLDFFKHYDGPMFERIENIHHLRIDNSVFDDIVSYLYYPSPYQFDVIPLKTISDIYDRFLSYSLQVDGESVNIVLKDEYRKSKGAVTTPQRVVRNVIEQTIDETALHSLSLDGILSTRIVDPACGSGAFLIEIYDYLADMLKNYFLNHPKEVGNMAVVRNGECLLTIEGRKAIMANCVYGVDIDPEAVEVAKMSLSLKVIDDFNREDFETVGIHGNQILSGVGDNIVLGNSLVSSDILDYSLDLFSHTSELLNTRIFDWSETFPTVFANGGFDYVIGNPPYVEVKNYNQGLPTMAAFIKDRYSCCVKGKVDLSIPFIEKGLDILNARGRLGYIVQKRFFKTEYGEQLRKYVVDANLLHGIYDYTENDLFRGKTTYVAIIVLDKNTDDNQRVVYRNSQIDQLTEIPPSCLNSKNWSLENIPITILTDQLTNRLGKLEDFFEVKVGIQVLWVNAYHIHAERVVNGIIYGSSTLDADVRIEEKACRRLVCNDQFVPLCGLGRCTYAVFPYDINDGVKRKIPFSEYADRFPLAASYLMKHKATIIQNVQIQPDRTPALNRDEYWHVFTRENNIACRYPKVVIPMTSIHPQASVAQEYDICCDNVNVNYIQVMDGDVRTLYAIAAIINSRVFGILAYYGANPSNNGYRKYNKEFLYPVPFPCQAFVENDNRLVELSQIAQSIEQLKNETKGIFNNGAEVALRRQWNRIDDICRDLYGLDDTEWHLFEQEEAYDR